MWNSLPNPNLKNRITGTTLRLGLILVMSYLMASCIPSGQVNATPAFAGQTPDIASTWAWGTMEAKRTPTRGIPTEIIPLMTRDASSLKTLEAAPKPLFCRTNDVVPFDYRLTAQQNLVNAIVSVPGQGPAACDPNTLVQIFTIPAAGSGRAAFWAGDSKYGDIMSLSGNPGWYVSGDGWARGYFLPGKEFGK